MAIKCKVATYGGNPRKIMKDLTMFNGATEITISAYKEIDDLTCEFILEGHGYHGTNYMQVSWNDGEKVKYYFIENRVGMPGDRTKIKATCDVLTTYQGPIMAAPAIINRTSNADLVNNMLRDNKVTTTSNTIVSSENLQNIGEIGNFEYYYVGVLQNVASTLNA